RFPPTPTLTAEGGCPTLLFAGLVDEPMKGFAVLHEACRRLWARRQDFVLAATSDPPGQIDEFTRFVGWQSQDDLPRFRRPAGARIAELRSGRGRGRETRAQRRKTPHPAFGHPLPAWRGEGTVRGDLRSSGGRGRETRAQRRGPSRLHSRVPRDGRSRSADRR